MQTEGRTRSRVQFWNENTTMFLVFSLHRKWKLWVWPRSIAPVNRQEKPSDDLEFHCTQFSKVYTLICICFNVILWYCVNVLNMTGNEACILPCERHVKKLYSIIHGFLTNLFIFELNDKWAKYLILGHRAFMSDLQRGVVMVKKFVFWLPYQAMS